MFEFKFDKLEKLIAILQALVPFDDVCFQVDAESISTRQMGKNLGQMVDMKLNHDLFDEYRFDCQNRVNIAFNVDQALNVLKKHDTDSSVTCRWRELSEDVIEFEVDKFSASIPLNTTAMDDLEIPDRLYDMEIDIPSAMLADVVNKFSSIDVEVLEFQASFNTMVIKAKSSSNICLSESYPNGDVVQWRWNSASGLEEFSMGFAFNSIKEFTKAKKLSDVIVLRISQMTPLCATYDLSNSSYVSYYLAPRDL